MSASRAPSVSIVRYSAAVEAAMRQSFPSDDPLDQPTFDPVEHVNKRFPNEASLAQLPSFVAELEAALAQTEAQLLSVVRQQVTSPSVALPGVAAAASPNRAGTAAETDHVDPTTDAATHARVDDSTTTSAPSATATSSDFSAGAKTAEQELDNAHHTVQRLQQRMRAIQQRSSKTEQLMNEVCANIRHMDCARSNLAASIKHLKNLQMYMIALQSLHTAIETQDFTTMAAQVKQVQLYAAKFERFKDLPKIRELRDRTQTVTTRIEFLIRNNVIGEIARRPGHVTMKNLTDSDVEKLLLATQVIDALGAEATQKARAQFIDGQLEQLELLMKRGSEDAKLERLERRFARFRALLDANDRVFTEVFPPSWKVPHEMCLEFCLRTQRELRIQLDEESARVDPFLLSIVVPRAIEAERDLTSRMRSLDEVLESRQSTSEGAATDLHATRKQVYRFSGLIARVFEPYMNLYVAHEQAEMGKILKGLEGGDTVVDDLKVFQGSQDLFLFVQESLRRVLLFDHPATLVDLTRVWLAHMDTYATMLLKQCAQPAQLLQAAAGGATMNANAASATSLLSMPFSTPLSSTSQTPPSQAVLASLTASAGVTAVMTLCVVLNTADFCSRGTTELSDNMTLTIAKMVRGKNSGVNANATSSSRGLGESNVPLPTDMNQTPEELVATLPFGVVADNFSKAFLTATHLAVESLANAIGFFTGEFLTAMVNSGSSATTAQVGPVFVAATSKLLQNHISIWGKTIQPELQSQALRRLVPAIASRLVALLFRRDFRGKWKDATVVQLRPHYAEVEQAVLRLPTWMSEAAMSQSSSHGPSANSLLSHAASSNATEGGGSFDNASSSSPVLNPANLGVFHKIAKREFGRTITLLKVMECDLQQLPEMYYELVHPDERSVTQCAKILDLKGVKAEDVRPLLAVLKRLGVSETGRFDNLDSIGAVARSSAPQQSGGASGAMSTASTQSVSSSAQMPSSSSSTPATVASAFGNGLLAALRAGKEAGSAATAAASTSMGQGISNNTSGGGATTASSFAIASGGANPMAPAGGGTTTGSTSGAALKAKFQAVAAALGRSAVAANQQQQQTGGSGSA